MNRRRIIIGGAAIVVTAAFIATTIVSIGELQRIGKNNSNAVSQEAVFPAATSSAPISQNAFYPGSPSGGSFSFGKNLSQPPADSMSRNSLVSGTANESISTPTSADTPTATVSAPAVPSATELLAIPTVSDSEITIDPSGASTALSFLEAFNNPSSSIDFNYKEFNSVIKDKNGVVLFVPDLADQALTDNNFAEISSSLRVQRDFTNAEISYLKSLKVTGGAIAINKEVIGVEELTDELIKKALSVNAGTLSASDFGHFNNQFIATMNSAHDKLIAQMGTISFLPRESWFEQFLSEMGGVARAQVPTGIPFGGPVTVVVPCDSGIMVTIGPPAPATIFATDEFMATPLFFLYRATHIGAFWLGIYEPVPVPCFVGPAPVGFGEDVLMVGTSI